MLGLESSRRSYQANRSRHTHAHVEPLEERQLLSVAPGYVDRSILTAEMVDQYGQALFGTDWTKNTGLTAEGLYSDIQEHSAYSHLESDENAFIVEFREKIVALGPNEAQKLFDEELNKAGLPLLDIAHSKLFRNATSNVETSGLAPAGSVGSDSFVGPLLPPTSKESISPASGGTSFTFDGTTPIAMAMSSGEGPGTIKITPYDDLYLSPGELAAFEVTWDGDEGDGFTIPISSSDGSAIRDVDYAATDGLYEIELVFHDGDEGTTQFFNWYGATSNPPVGPIGANPATPEARSFTVNFDSPVLIPSEDDGEGIPGGNSEAEVIITQPVTPDTPDNGPEEPEDPDDCGCSDSQAVTRGVSSLNSAGPQPSASRSSDSSIRTKVAQLEGDLLLRQSVVSGALARETALVYQSDDGLHPVVTIDPTVPAAGEDKVLLSADAQLKFYNVVQDTATFTSDIGIEQGELISISLQGTAETPTGHLVETGLWDFEVEVTYHFGFAPESGMPLDPEQVTVTYHSYQPVVNRFVYQSQVGTLQPTGNNWWINGWDKLYLRQYPMVVFGNGDVALFSPAGVDPGDGLPIWEAPGFAAILKHDVQTDDYTLTFDDGSFKVFVDGEVSYTQTASGYRVDYHYDPNPTNPYLASISDSRGNVVAFDSDGVTKTTYGVQVSTTSWSINPTTGNLDSITRDPNSGDATSVVTFDYDTNDRLHATTTANGTTTYTYEDSVVGRLELLEHPDGTTYEVQSVESERLDFQLTGDFARTSRMYATVTDERGNSTYVKVDRYGKPLSIIDAQSGDDLFAFVRDDGGNVTQVTTADPRDPENANITTTYTYQNGELTSVSYPDGSYESWTYDSVYTYKVRTHTDRLGRLTVYVIDPNTGDTLSERRVVDGDINNVGPNDVTTSFTYTQPGNQHGLPPGLLLAMTAPLGAVTTYEYYAQQNLSFGKVHTITYATGLPEEATVSYAYDAGITDFWDEIGRRTRYQYDAFGRLIKTYLPDPLSLGDYSLTRMSETHYDAMGNVISTTNALGQTTDSVYNPAYYDPVTETVHPRLTVTQPDPNGSNPSNRPTTIYDYDAVGNLVKLTDPLGRISRYVYNDRNQLVSSFQPDPDDPTNPAVLGLETSYTYDMLGLLRTMTDPLGNVTTYEYDINARQARVIQPHPTTVGASGDSTYAFYDAEGQLASTIDAKGYTASYTYDDLGRAWKTFLPDANGNANPLTSTLYVEYGYDKNGNRTTFRDALGNVTTYDFDNRDRLTDVYLPNPDTGASGSAGGGPHTATFYRDDSSADYTVDPMGRTTTYAYDFSGRITGVTFTSADETRSISTFTAYDNGDRVISTTDANGYTTTYEHDNLDRQTDVYQPHPDTGASGPSGGGPHIVTTYNLAGEVESVSDPLGRVTSYEYDGMGRQKRVSPPDPDGNPLTVDTPIVEYTYDENSNLKTQTTYVGATPLVTSYSYDNLNRLKQVIQPNGDTTTYGYDANNNRTSVFDGTNTTTYVFDTRNRLWTETNELGKVRTHVYDANNQIKVIDRNGRETEYVYDHLNRLIEENWLDGMAVIATLSFAYNAANQLTSASDDNASYTYTYDVLGRQKTVTADLDGLTPSVALTNSLYDNNSNRWQLDAVIGGVKDFSHYSQFDSLDRRYLVIQRNVSAGNQVAEISVVINYDLAGQLSQIDYHSFWYPDSLISSSVYDYDPAGRLVGLTQTPDVADEVEYAWQYNRSNRITESDSPDGTQDYGYDDSGQLTSASLTSESYAYDDNGNRLAYTTGDDNRLQSDGTYAYTYDDEGNLIEREEIATGYVRVFEYDHRNRLVAVRDYDDVPLTGNLLQEVEYAYDVFNRRVLRSVDGVDEHYVYDGDDVVLDFVGNGSSNVPAHRYLHGNVVDQLFAQENVAESFSSPDRVYWFLGDNQNTTRDILDNDGDLVEHYEYDSFGNTLAGDASLTRYLWTGREFDEDTGLQYNRNRWYDASVGRWISQDPIGFEGDQSNLYRYVENKPLIAVDPDGLDMAISGGDGFASHNGLEAEVRDSHGRLLGILTADYGAAGYGDPTGPGIFDLCTGTLGKLILTFNSNRPLAGRKYPGTTDDDNRLVDWILRQAGSNRTQFDLEIQLFGRTSWVITPLEGQYKWYRVIGNNCQTFTWEGWGVFMESLFPEP